MVLKLYSLLEGPPSISVRQTLAALKLPYELINVKYFQGEHLTEEFDKVSTFTITCFLSVHVNLSIHK